MTRTPVESKKAQWLPKEKKEDMGAMQCFPTLPQYTFDALTPVNFHYIQCSV